MTIPLENLDDKTYADLVKESLARIPVYAPQWTDWNESDPGITLIELLAWLTEMQIYSLNRIGERSRLKFLKLLGVPRSYPPKPAEVNLTFKLNGDSIVSIPKGTIVASLNPDTGDLICFETVEEVSLNSPTRTATVHAIKGKERREFESDESRNLRVELNESMFILSNETIKNMLKVWVNGAEWEYKGNLDRSATIDHHFTADPEDGTVTFGDGVHGKIPKGKIIVEYRSGVGSRGNVRAGSINQILDGGLASIMSVMNLDAAYGGTDADEPIESAIGRARKDLREITRAVTAADYEHLALACPDVDLARVKALEMHHPSYDYQVPTAVSVVIAPEKYVFSWEKIPEIDDENERLRTFLRKKYDLDWINTASFDKSEDGKTINISANDSSNNSLSLALNNNESEAILKINEIVTDTISTKKKDGELEIYRLARPTKKEISSIRDHLENYRLLGTNLFVIAPEYVKVKVETEVVKDPRYKDDSVKAAVRGKLAEFLDPRKGGGPDRGGWPFGRPVYLSEIMQVIDGTEGVDHVQDCKLYSCVEMFVFRWEKVPGIDNKKLQDFLVNRYNEIDADLTWICDAELTKSEDRKTISISIGDKNLSLTLNNEESKAILKIGNQIIAPFLAKKENGELNIYGKSKWLESEEDTIRIQASSLIYSELKDQTVTVL